MADIKGSDAPKKHPAASHSQPPSQPPQSAPATVNLQLQAEHLDTRPLPSPSPSTAPFISAPHFIPGLEQFEAVNPKRARFGQWKVLGSPPRHYHVQMPATQMAGLPATESSPSPSRNMSSHGIGQATGATATVTVTVASSSDTASASASSPNAQSPIPAGAGQQESSIGKPPEAEQSQPGPAFHPQFRKGKYVSPVWKPNEMLWLARAWRLQYQGVSSTELDPNVQMQILEGASSGPPPASGTGRGKTRAEKDREVAEFLNRHGVNRDAKTAGTKWDNMLGEFRKVYEWERGGEREHVGKSYFRLSPYERKIHRLPASFDEEVFEELSQFMGPRMRTPLPLPLQVQPRFFPGIAAADEGRPLAGAGAGAATGTSRVPPPPPPSYSSKDDEIPLTAKAKQLAMTGAMETCYHSRGSSSLFLGYEAAQAQSQQDAVNSSSKDLRRIGKVRMTWEESASLWAEEGEHHRGRIKLQGSMSFLYADDLTFFDESMVACPMEAFEDGPFRGFSVDRFVPGQQVKVFGRRKSSPLSSSSGVAERLQLPSSEQSVRAVPPWEFHDPTEYYVGCLKIPPPTLPSLLELPWYLQEPPPEDLRFPLRRDVYRDLPQGRETFFTTSHEPLDCRALVFDILSPIICNQPGISIATASSRDSYIALWDDCINRVVSKFCSVEIVMVRKPSSDSEGMLQELWPNLTGFLRNFCLWRGEEADRLRDSYIEPSTSIVGKLLWTFGDLPYILGYHAVGHAVTFCALSRSQDRVIRTDLCTIDLSLPCDRMKALVPCYRIAGLLALLSDRCINNIGSHKLFLYSDFERIDLGGGDVMEMTPRTVVRIFATKRKWSAVKEIYDFLDQRVPHSEFMVRSLEKDLSLVFKPRGIKSKPASFEQLVDALMYVTKALVALHDLSFMHGDLSWDKVVRRSDNEGEWVVCGFDEAAASPQLYPRSGEMGGRGMHAPEMGRGLHNVKVDIWGVGFLVKTSGLNGGGPKLLKELQNRCLDHNPENRPTAADCYHHLLQLQSAFHSSAAASTGGTY